MQAYQQALRDAEAHFNLAHLYGELGRKQGAVRHLQIDRRPAGASH